jgi:hypothetical protein
MTARAAINILGSTGEILDISSLGSRDITSLKVNTGQYIISGTLGMVPLPEGWGYVVNQLDSDATVSIGFDGEDLAVEVSRDGAPSDLVHSITLHVAVTDWVIPAMPEPAPAEPEPVPDPLVVVQSAQAQLRAYADYVITPLQDAVDLEEASPADIDRLKAWKKYRVTLSKIAEQPGYPIDIDWPDAPI